MLTLQPSGCRDDPQVQGAGLIGRGEGGAGEPRRGLERERALEEGLREEEAHALDGEGEHRPCGDNVRARGARTRERLRPPDRRGESERDGVSRRSWGGVRSRGRDRPRVEQADGERWRRRLARRDDGDGERRGAGSASAGVVASSSLMACNLLCKEALSTSMGARRGRHAAERWAARLRLTLRATWP